MKIQTGINMPQDVIYEGDVKGEGLAIFISEEDPASLNRWFMKVFVHVSQGWFLLGFVTSNTAVTDGAAARAVAFASCPGAKGWKVVVQNSQLPSDNSDFDAEMTLAVGLCCGGGSPYGVFVPPPPGSGGVPTKEVPDGAGL